MNVFKIGNPDILAETSSHCSETTSTLIVSSSLYIWVLTSYGCQPLHRFNSRPFYSERRNNRYLYHILKTTGFLTATNIHHDSRR